MLTKHAVLLLGTVILLAILTVMFSNVSAEEENEGSEELTYLSEEKEGNLTSVDEAESSEGSDEEKDSIPMAERYALIIVANLTTVDQNEVSKAVSLYKHLLIKGWYQNNIEFLGPDQITAASGIANISNVEEAFNGLVDNTVGSKEILILISDHLVDLNYETFLTLSDGNISSSVINGWLDNMTYSKLTFIMNGEHSGLAGPEFCGPSRSVICSMGSDDEYSPDQFNITRGLSNPKADTNKDGEVSFVEAYYSEKNYLRRTSNQVPELW